MESILNVVFAASVGIWLAGEVALQLRSYLAGRRSRATEWRSLLVLVAAGVAGGLLSGRVEAAFPGLAGVTGQVPWLVGGLSLAWAGIVLRLWSIHTLGAYFRGVVHVQEGHRVVDRGPYRVLRHPSYAGGLVGILGFGLTSGNVAATAVLIGCVLAGMLYRIRVEERVLRTALGAAYTGYAARTSRLIPGLW